MPPDLLTTGEHFALEVRGDNVEAGILDGDMALLKRTTPPTPATTLSR